MKYRREKDCIGTKEIPADAYYGVHGSRAEENFRITGRKISPYLIIAIAQIKKACAESNKQAGILDSQRAFFIEQACDEIVEGRYHKEFIVDAIQGGAGTSTNMNANEVIANIALVKAGHNKGEYQYCHPNDHVNMSQSTNDVYPTAVKLALYRMSIDLIEELDLIYQAFMKKSQEFSQIIKLGRTQLMDAVPVTLGQEFHAYGAAVRRNKTRIEKAMKELLCVNLSGTAIGTGINVPTYYRERIIHNLRLVTGIEFKGCGDLIDGTQNIDCFSSLSSAVKTCAISLSKIANDIRLMNSGPCGGIGEIKIPAKQNGSSIMPGKINPVIPEVVSQCAYAVAGNDLAVTMACEAGQLELNAFEPLIFDRVSESLKLLKNGVNTFRVNCIEGIVANSERCNELLEQSTALSTALCPVLGYYETVDIARDFLINKNPIIDNAKKKGLSDREICQIMDYRRLTGQI